MIVATCTANRLTQKRLSNDIQLLIDVIHFKLLFVLLFKIRIPHREEAGRDQLHPSLIRVVGAQQVSRDLLSYHLIERAYLATSIHRRANASP